MSGARKHGEYVVAALLHDIGKLIRRAKLCNGVDAASHVEESLRFVDQIQDALKAAGLDVDHIKNLIREHHRGAYGVAPYDHAAASERAQGGRGLALENRHEGEIPLVIYIDGGKAAYVPPAPLPATLEEAEELAPRAESPPRNEVCNHYAKSYQRLMKLASELNGRKMGFQQLAETLVYVLRSAATFVPAAVYGVEAPDTSLYAHSVLAAALASTGGEFVLVALDVGKIQDYIRRARVTKGAMAILRGRSLMINLLQKIATRQLLEEVNKRLNAEVATWANVLLDTGGEVLLLLPHVEGLGQILEELEGRVLEDTEGVLTLYAAYTGPHRLDEVQNFKNLLTELERRVAERKMRYREYPPPGPKAPTRYDAVCDFCGRPAKTERIYIRDQSLDLCRLCRDEYHAGLSARNLKAVVVTRGGPPVAGHISQCEAASFKLLDYAVYVIGGDQCDADAFIEVVTRGGRGAAAYLANKPDAFIRRVDYVGYGFFFTNQYLPTEDGAVKSLEDLGDYAVFLKADANEMGKKKAAASAKPSLLLTFAAAVSTAYELYPALLASERRRDDIFVIYAGGDDLALAGGLAALKYASQTARYAERWGFRTAMGIKIDDPHVPIYYAWGEADARLKKAKTRGRDRNIAVVVTEPVEIWIDAEKLGNLYDYAEVDKLAGEEETKRLTRIIYNQLLKMYTAATQNHKKELAKATIELAYVLNRRGEDPQPAIRLVRRLSDLDIAPDNLPKLYNKLAKTDEETLEKLRTAILGLYLLHLKT